MARSNRSKRIKVDKEQAGGSPAYTLHGEQGLLSGKSFGYTPLPLTVHGAGFSDHIVSTSGGGRKARRSSARRSSANAKRARRASGARRSSANAKRANSANARRASSARRSSANARRSSARRSSARRSSARRSSANARRASGVNNNDHPPPYNIVTQNHKNKINKKESMIQKYLYKSGPNLNLVKNSIKNKMRFINM
jgi:hypothetical protein